MNNRWNTRPESDPILCDSTLGEYETLAEARAAAKAKNAERKAGEAVL